MIMKSRLRIATYSIALVSAFGACSRSAEPTSNEPAPALPVAAIVFDFEDGTVGQPPAGFTAALTGGGGAIDWQVQERPGSPSGTKVLAQLSVDDTRARYPHITRDDFVARDVDLSVHFKTTKGEEDAAGGLVFRYRDKGNYYVVRANALEDNVVAYKTTNGTRSNIGVKGKGGAYGVKIDVPHQRWNTLRVIARGQLFEVFLNGRKLFEVEDNTFADPGRVGLWTKADAVTEFDDLRVQSLDSGK
jgi:hypothetical protein